MQRPRLIILKVIFLLLTFFIMLSNFYALDNTKQEAAAGEGVLDLAFYDFDRQGKLILDGEWQFYPGRFVEPAAYSDFAVSGKPDVYTKPPTVWNYYEINNKPIPGFGYGTYRMAVTGIKPDVPMAIRILPQSTAYELYVDDILMAGNGIISRDKEHSAPGYRPNSVIFTPHSSECVITVHISNYVFARGGMWDAPILGTKAQIEDLDSHILHRDLFLQGCYCIIFLFFLAIFISRPRNSSCFFFAMLCVVTAARVLIYGAHLITQYTENFRFITFIEYGTRLWFPILMLLLLNDELQGRISKKLLYWLTAAVLGLTAAVAILPIHIYTAFARVLMAYDLLLGAVMLVILIWPGERFFPKSQSKIFFIYGISAIYICVLYDMFYATTAYLEMTPIGFFVALLAFAFILAIAYTEALIDCETALSELRTESERKLQTELKLLQSQIRPHFIYNALSAIANVCRKDGGKAEQLILDLAYFMQASFDFSSSGKLTTLENELEYISKYVHIEEARFGEKVRYSEEIDVPLTVQLPRLIIEPLVENAIRHGILKKKGGGEVKLRIFETQGGIRVEVSDNGIGMSQEKLSDIFKGDSKGVGLKNIQDRLVRTYGDGLTIESVLMEYTNVSFTIKEGN